MKKGAFRFPMIKIEGGGTLPDPAIYCPSNGFIPDPDIYVPPVPLPPISPQTMIFICNAAIGGWTAASHKYKIYRSGSNLPKYEIFDATGTLVDSFYAAGYFIDFDFPTSEGYYTVKISLEAPSYFTGFYNNDGGSSYYNNCIEAIIMNTPNIGQFAHPFNINLKSVVWANNESFAALGGLSYMFQNCVQFQTFNLMDIDYSAKNWSMMSAFSGSGLKKLDLTKLGTAPDLHLVDNLVSGCKYLDEIIFPSNWSGTRLSGMLRDTVRLRKLVMPDTWNSVTAHNNSMSYFLYNSGVEGEVVLNEVPGIDTIAYFFSGCTNVEIVRIKGDWSLVKAGGDSNVLTGCTSLNTFEAPRVTGLTVWSTLFSTALTSLRYYIGPDVGYLGFPVNSGVISITGNNDNSAMAANSKSIVLSTTMRTTLSTFNCPKLVAARFSMGTTLATKFTIINSIVIDWVNSDWSNTTSPQLSISAAIDAVEINRIGNLVTNVSGKTCDFRYCDGYATMDKTIWTAKGWTVL